MKWFKGSDLINRSIKAYFLIIKCIINLNFFSVTVGRSGRAEVTKRTKPDRFQARRQSRRFHSQRQLLKVRFWSQLVFPYGNDIHDDLLIKFYYFELQWKQRNEFTLKPGNCDHTSRMVTKLMIFYFVISSKLHF